MAIKTSLPTFFPTKQTFAFWRNKDKFFDYSSYTIAFMLTNVAQKVTQCLRKDKKPDKRSETPIHYTVCLIIPSTPQFIDENGKIINFSWHTWGVKLQQLPLLYKSTKQVYAIPKQREGVRKIANLPEIVSFMYQKAHKMSAVSKWAMLRPDLVRYLECSRSSNRILYSHLTVYLSPVNLSVA